MGGFVTIVDPPDGWRYGFPKAMPTFEGSEQRRQWFIDQGYPESLIEQGMLKHCRYWEKQIDKDD
jgi:hypothetical protein